MSYKYLNCKKVESLLSKKDMAKEIFEELEFGPNSAFSICRAKSQKPGSFVLQKYPSNKLKKWPIFSGSYRVRDPRCSVAVAFPFQEEVLLEEALRAGAAIAGPCVTPDLGPEIVISNILANPNIRYLIVAGKESGHMSGDILSNANWNGVDPKTKRVIGTKSKSNPYFQNLSQEDIEKFKKRVKVINFISPYFPEDRKNVANTIKLIVRCCLQEPWNKIRFKNKMTGQDIVLFDPGSEGLSPHITALKKPETTIVAEGISRNGSSIHARYLADAYEPFKSYLLVHGSWGKEESGRFALDMPGFQITIEDTTKNLVPRRWYPEGWLTKFNEVVNYVESYATWVYLFPLSIIRKSLGKYPMPYIPDMKLIDYSYGTRITTYWIDLASRKEKRRIIKNVEEIHKKYCSGKKVPSFDEIIKFHEKLSKVQKKSFNQLRSVARQVALCVKEGIGASYRIYMSLHIPIFDMNDDPREAHQPCFIAYAFYPRLIENKWQLDAVMYMRANDVRAMPANAYGGIKLMHFVAHWASKIAKKRILPGVYTHQTGCANYCDYMLPKNFKK